MEERLRKILSIKLKRAIGKGNLGMIARIAEELEEGGVHINSLSRYGNGATALMLASENPNPSMVDALCQMGADVNAVDTTGNTALHYASAKGNSSCVILLCSQPGSNPNITRLEPVHLGESPLMYACWKCTPEAVGALIARGADVSAARQVDDRFTPLMYAIHNVHGPVAARRCVELLLAAGADIYAVDSDGDAVFNQYRWEEVRTAGPGRNLSTAAVYEARKQALAAGKLRSNTLQREMNLMPPYGKNFVALQAKYRNHPAFAQEVLSPTNLSLVRNTIGGRRITRRHRGGTKYNKTHNMENYYTRRKDYNYYKKVKEILDAMKFSSIIDIGSRKSPVIGHLGKNVKKTMLNIEPLEPAEHTKMITADFYTWEPDIKYDVALCLQVLEHLDKPKEFAKKLFQTAKHVIISVPYKWEKGLCKFHVQDPIDEAKMREWTGRDAKESHIIKDGNRERIILLY